MEVGQLEPSKGLPVKHMVFSKIEKIVKEMQDSDSGIPVKSQTQKLFLGSSVPSAFTGYDLVEWMMSKLKITDSMEALHLANLLTQYGYFFPVESKILQVKDDNSLYRFQTPYFWVSQNTSPDDTDYAVYLVKSMQRCKNSKKEFVLEDYEVDQHDRLKQRLRHKWDFIQVQADEQTKLAKDRKRVDRVILDSQEKAFWRVHRPPPGEFKCLESGQARNYKISFLTKRKNKVELKKEIDFLREMLLRTRVKASQAGDIMVNRCDQYQEHDPMVCGVLPSNPWITDDTALWIIEADSVEIPTEQRVKRWGLSFEELVRDTTGLRHFQEFLRSEFSEENIKFWLSVEEMKKCSNSQVEALTRQIYKEFLAPGAPHEINIDSKSLKITEENLKTLTGPKLRHTFQVAQEHISLLMKKDSYNRFLRSESYKSIQEAALQPQKQKKFTFGFGRKNKLTNPSPLLSRRRGSSSSEKNVKEADDGRSSPLSGIVNSNLKHVSLSASNLRDLEDDGGLYMGEVHNSDSSNSRLDVLHHSESTPNHQRRVSLDVPRSSKVSHASSETSDDPDEGSRVTNKDGFSIKVPQRTPTPNEVCPWDNTA